MNKKDRISVVASVLYTVLVFILASFAESGGGLFILWLFYMIPAIAYWGYRFIKNDISFLNIKDK